MSSLRTVLASLLFAAACSSAYADLNPGPPGQQIAAPRTALAIANAKVRAPYDVQVIREDGSTEPTYAFKDRFYVQGSASERYTIRVTNPTPNRVEAVVTVDGLDVIDGEDGDLHKRGYVVPPYGETRIEGFRTSTDNVATFRFSSVDGSYAGQKGKARNVGVIAVAIFEEQGQPQMIAPDDANVDASAKDPNHHYDYKDDLDTRTRGAGPTYNNGGVAKGGVRRYDADKTTASADRPAPPPPRDPGSYPAKKMAPAPTTAAPAGSAQGGVGGAPYHAGHATAADYGGDKDGEVAKEEAPTTGRLGLGTQFGEQRYSAAQWTRFVRATDRPVAIAELRYNDVAGLMALGIPVQPLPDDNEINTRETADPFPVQHFSNRP